MSFASIRRLYREHAMPDSNIETALTGAMGAKLLAFTEIPVIDIAALSGDDPAAFAETARKIGVAAKTVGFFYITNHGVPAELIERTYALSKAFHTAPLERRMEVHVAHSPGTRGYVPSSVQWTDPDPELHRLVEPDPGDHDFLTKPLLHAAFDVSLEIADDDPDYRAGNLMIVPNQWPAWMPEMRPQLMEYYAAVTQVGERLFRAFAVSLGLPEDFFAERAQKPPSQLRLLYYPPNDLPMNKDNVGIGQHSDFECFTILNQQAPGLQVMNAADEWVEAPPIPGSFIVNIGDLLEGWTNGLFKATQHRVVNTGRERFSMPLFFAVDYHTVVEPLPQFVDAQNPAAYTTIVAGKHLAGFSVNACKHLRKRILAGEVAIDFQIHKVNPFKRHAVNELEDAV
jgi:isopenicillin N synthase-like dioxygenase